jgi:hypothetical protein
VTALAAIAAGEAPLALTKARCEAERPHHGFETVTKSRDDPLFRRTGR